VNAWKVILATLVIFITGVVTGGLLVNYTYRTHQKNRRPPTRESSRPPLNLNSSTAGNPRDPVPRFSNLQNRLARGVSMEFLQRLDAQVHLTPGQRERIEKIIIEGQQRNKEHWERIAPELRREMMETQKRIRETLTPEQRARFEELMKQSRTGGREFRRPTGSRNSAHPDSPTPAPAE